MRKCKKGRIARALLSGAYDVYNKFFGDVQVCNIKIYEGKIAYKNIEECVKINKNGKNLFVLDRNYTALDLFNEIEKIEDFKEIYKARWKIEESYNSIKNKLKIEKCTRKLQIYVY